MSRDEKCFVSLSHLLKMSLEDDLSSANGKFAVTNTLMRELLEETSNS